MLYSNTLEYSYINPQQVFSLYYDGYVIISVKYTDILRFIYQIYNLQNMTHALIELGLWYCNNYHHQGAVLTVIRFSGSSRVGSPTQTFRLTAELFS